MEAAVPGERFMKAYEGLEEKAMYTTGRRMDGKKNKK